MDQPTFADLEYRGKKRKTRRELFLERMDALIPWQLLEDRIRPFYPKAGRGRHPYPLSVMLRVHCVQLFYNLSDPGMEDLLYESDPVRRFVGLKLSGPLPDETTILNFRHLLERNQLGQGLLAEINAHLESRGLRLREGAIVDATIIEAPSSTKNRTGERDPEMHQTKKGNQWYFGMKAHILRQAQDGGLRYGHSAQHDGHGGQHSRRYRGPQSVARRRGGGVGRRRVSGARQAGRELGAGGGIEGGDASGEAAKAGAWERRGADGEGESVSKGQGGASLPEIEAVVRLRQGALPGAGEEHGAAGFAVRAE